MQGNQQLSLNRLAWIITAIASLIHFLPYFILGCDAYVRIHDTLEGEWIWLHILNETHTAWSFDPNAVVQPVMNGLPRSAFPTGLSLNMVMVSVFGTFWGYVGNKMLVHLVGFLSMFILLRKHYIPGNERKYIVIFISLLFSLIPVYSAFGVSVMAQPLILYAFLNILKGDQKLTDFLIIILFPLWSSIVWAGIPVLTALGIIWIFDAVRNRRINFGYLSAMAFLTMMYALINYPIFSLSFFSKDFVPHREIYNLYMFDRPNFGSSLGEFFIYFTTNHYHVATFLTLPILIAVLMVIRFRFPEWRPGMLVAIIVIICLFQGFYSYFEYYLGGQLRFLSSFRLNRFSILLPFIWLIAFSLSLSQFHKSDYFRPMVIPFLVAQMLIIMIGNDEILHNYRRITHTQTFPSYNQYLAPEQFTEIREYIGEPAGSYRVASLGISPTIAQYNGFYTLDGLQSVYDLHYKLEFRKIFEGELEKSDALKGYFDGWGNRCYIFSSELGKEYPAYMVSKHQEKTLKNFSFNASAFRNLGGKYLISALEIENHSALNLRLERIFENEDSWWRIFLYSAEPEMNTDTY